MLKNGCKVIVLLLFQAINTLLAVFQAYEHFRALQMQRGCL